jgi:PAT family beta-lactamase induction signal transducer AmpG
LSLRRKLGVIAFVYLIEGYPMGVFQDVWGVYFRTHEVSLALIGLISGLRLAWSAKVLWSPLIDRFGERRVWIAGANLAMAVALGVMATHGPRLDPLLWSALVLFCVASATQDVAIDAYTIGLVERGEEGPANSMRITAYRIAVIASGGGLVVVGGDLGWPQAWWLAAAVCVAMAVGVLRTPRVEVAPQARREMWPALRRWLSRPGAGGVFAFVLLYRVGDLAMGPMVKPLWVDLGFSPADIAFWSIAMGNVATILGAIAGGWWVSRRGIGPSLLALGFLALASNLGYAAAAMPGGPRTGVYAASFIESFCTGLVSVAFLSYLMHITQKEHAAVQYAALTAIYALPGTFFGAVSGLGVEELGYATYFAATAAIALPAFAFLPRARTWIQHEPDSDRDPTP